MSLQVAILGTVESSVDGDAVPLPAGRQRALLTLLAVKAPQPVSADVAAEALWPGASPREALRSVQVTVSRLRHSLGAGGTAIETVPAGYRLAIADDAIDARRFEALLLDAREARERGDAAAARKLLEAALALWRGPPLADVAFEGFAQGEIARLEELHAGAIEERLEARIDEGEHAHVVAELEQLAAEQPSRERLLALLMLALYRSGRQADALEVYRRGRSRLDEELGLRPSAELRALQEAILRQDPSLDPKADGERELSGDGLVTMLFTDIEGSTRLARTAGRAWAAALAEHHVLLRDAVEGAGGRVDGTEGDAVFAYFADPGAAVRAATVAQAALRSHGWESPVGDLRVRMGIHAGAVHRDGVGYSGLAVHLTARVTSAAHGGQVLVSDAARALLAEQVELADLGEHRLKDFPEPERLWQLISDGEGPDAFPPLRTEPVRPTNLPADPRPLVGREREIALLQSLLTGTERLVTVVGLGGTGKTRLASGAAEGLLSAFEGGVWLVSLAGVRDADAVLPAIATAIGVEDDGSPLDAAIARRLRARPTLLVLDNFEQLVDAAQTVEALLLQTPHTCALVTSQLPLRLARERLLRLGPLGPESAAALFHQRAGAAAPDYDASDHEEAVVAICARIDGMPLAIELAAARVASIAPADLLARLDRSPGLLARGPRDLHDRHRSLRAALDWTHALLEPGERALLARLAAFAGAAPLEAVEAIAEVGGDHGPLDALEALSGLVDASFVQRIDHREYGVRYTVAQAVRDYAGEQLAASGEEHAVREAHALHVAAVAATFRGVATPDVVVARVLALEEEFAPALAWTREHAPPAHLRVAAGLGLVLNDRGRAREAHEELELAIARFGITDATSGWAAVACAFAGLGVGSTAESERMDAGLGAVRAYGDVPLYLLALRLAAVYWRMILDPARALACSTEQLRIARGRSDPRDLGPALADHANVLVGLGRLDEAESLFHEAAPLLRALGASEIDVDGMFDELAAARGDWARAGRLFLANARSLRHTPGLKGLVLRHTAVALAHLGADEGALELLACANALCELFGEATSDPLTTRYGQALSEARERVGPDGVADATRRGLAIPEEDSVTRAEELLRAAGVSGIDSG